jgi:ADP-heptose:LPS heptosyltransferase
MFGTRPRLSFPPKRWRTLLTDISAAYPEYGLVLTGGAKDKMLIEEISEGLPHTRVLIGLPILEVAGIINGAAVYMGVDTGVTHVAAVLHKPSIVIGNNSNPIWWPSYNPHGTILVNSERCTCTGDKNDDCRVYEDGVGYHRCTYDISIEEVMRTLKDKMTVV